MKVLLVDDDRFVIEALKRGIDWNALGISDVFTAFDIINARMILKSEHIDLLLSDIDMPHGSGLELLSGRGTRVLIYRPYFLRTMLISHTLRRLLSLRAFITSLNL